MDDIVLASPEQIERIRKESDFTPGTAVLAMGEDLAVVKQITEIDPVFFDSGSSNNRKLLFMWGLQNWLRLTGVPAYYFQIPAADEQYQAVMQHFGAENTSKQPEYRYVKVLNA